MSFHVQMVQTVVGITTIVAALPPQAYTDFERKSIKKAFEAKGVDASFDGQNWIEMETGEVLSVQAAPFDWNDHRCGPPAGFDVQIFNEDGSYSEFSFTLDEIRDQVE